MFENVRRSAALAILSVAMVGCGDLGSNPKEPPIVDYYSPVSVVMMTVSGDLSSQFFSRGHATVDTTTDDLAWAESAGYVAGGDIMGADVGENGAGDLVLLSLPSNDVGEYTISAVCSVEHLTGQGAPCARGALTRGLTGWDSGATERWTFVSGTVAVRRSTATRIEGEFSGKMNRLNEETGEVTGTAEVTTGLFGVDLIAGR